MAAQKYVKVVRQMCKMRLMSPGAASKHERQDGNRKEDMARMATRMHLPDQNWSAKSELVLR